MVWNTVNLNNHSLRTGGSQLCCEKVGLANQASWPGAPRRGSRALEPNTLLSWGEV